MAPPRLECTICPKRPAFSDLSHLLTHLASKGHLSHYFKAQVKSRQDNQALGDLQAFDKWYNDNEMDRLLHDRMVQKEKKKATGRSRQAITKASQPPARTTVSTSTSRRILSSYAESFGDALDPQLANMDSQTDISSAGARLGARSATNQYTANLAPGYDTGMHMVSSQPNPFASYFGSTQVQGLSAGINATMPAGLLSPRPSNTSTSRSVDGAKLDPHDIASSIEQDSDAEVNEYVTLKGVIWPGMDLFDSASPHAKRIRNQKKDSSCLEQMRSYAETIEPNEDIYFYPSWQLKKSREITGQVESSSPERSDPPPRAQSFRGRGKRSRGGRAPLAQLDGNRLPMKRKGKKLCNHNTQGSPSKLPAVNQNAFMHGHGNRWSLHHDDDLDWSITYGSYETAGKKSRMQVYRDGVESNTNSRLPVASTDNANEDLISTPCPRAQHRGLRNQHLAPSRQNQLSPNELEKLWTQQEDTEMVVDPFTSTFDERTMYNNTTTTNNPTDLYRQRYFGVDQSTDAAYVSSVVPPYLDFLMSYPAMPAQIRAPGNSDRSEANNPLSIFPNLEFFQQSPKEHDQNSASVNPLLDFSALVQQPIPPESDDETIEDIPAED